MLQRHTGSANTVKLKLNLGTLMETSDQLCTPAALHLGKSLVPNEKEPRQALGPMLATLLKRTYLLLSQESNCESLVVESVD